MKRLFLPGGWIVVAWLFLVGALAPVVAGDFLPTDPETDVAVAEERMALLVTLEARLRAGLGRAVELRRTVEELEGRAPVDRADAVRAREEIARLCDDTRRVDAVVRRAEDTLLRVCRGLCRDGERLRRSDDGAARDLGRVIAAAGAAPEAFPAGLDRTMGLLRARDVARALALRSSDGGATAPPVTERVPSPGPAGAAAGPASGGGPAEPEEDAATAAPTSGASVGEPDAAGVARARDEAYRAWIAAQEATPRDEERIRQLHQVYLERTRELRDLQERAR